MSVPQASIRSVRRLLTMALALSLLVAACGPATTPTPMGGAANDGGHTDGGMPMGDSDGMPGQQGVPGTGGEGSAASKDHVATAASPFPDAPTVQVTARDFGFEPSEIEIEVGTPTNITVENTGSAFHDFTVHELDFMIDVEAGQTVTGGIIVEQPGQYEVVCTVPGHAAAGMTATLVVR